MLESARRRILTGVFVVALFPLGSALFVRPRPIPPKVPPTTSARLHVIIAPAGTYALDAVIVGGQNIAFGSAPIEVRRGQAMIVAGWALDPLTMDQAQALAASIDGGTLQTLPGYGLARPDVASALGLPEAALSGFRSSLPIEHLRAGTHAAQLSIITGNARRALIPKLISFRIDSRP